MIDNQDYNVWDIRYSFRTKDGEQAVEYARVVISDYEKLAQAVEHHKKAFTERADGKIDVRIKKEGVSK